MNEKLNVLFENIVSDTKFTQNMKKRKILKIFTIIAFHALKDIHLRSSKSF